MSLIHCLVLFIGDQMEGMVQPVAMENGERRVPLGELESRDA